MLDESKFNIISFTNKYKVTIDNKFCTRRVGKKEFIELIAKNYYGKRTTTCMVPKIFNNINSLTLSDDISKTILKVFYLRDFFIKEVDKGIK